VSHDAGVIVWLALVVGVWVALRVSGWWQA